MIIWGFRVRRSASARGVFFCPGCGGDRPYACMRARRWFTLFFIPIIPLGYIGDEFVECDTCHRAYTLGVLRAPTTAALADALAAATREAVAWLLRSAGNPGPAALAVAAEVLTAATAASGARWGEEAVRADLAGLDITGLQARLGGLAPILSESGKERFLAACGRVAVADGALGGDQARMLESIAATLGMTPAHARGVIAYAVEQGPGPRPGLGRAAPWPRPPDRARRRRPPGVPTASRGPRPSDRPLGREGSVRCRGTRRPGTGALRTRRPHPHASRARRGPAAHRRGRRRTSTHELGSHH